MIRITRTVAIGDEEIQESFVRSSGPGGQNVNKVSTTVQLRFDVRNSPSLPSRVRQKLEQLAGQRLTSEGVLVIEARRFRTQGRNRQDALERLTALIRKACARPKTRRKTRPPAQSREKRLEAKRRRGDKKKLRARVQREE